MMNLIFAIDVNMTDEILKSLIFARCCGNALCGPESYKAGLFAERLKITCEKSNCVSMKFNLQDEESLIMNLIFAVNIKIHDQPGIVVALKNCGTDHE